MQSDGLAPKSAQNALQGLPALPAAFPYFRPTGRRPTADRPKRPTGRQGETGETGADRSRLYRRQNQTQADWHANDVQQKYFRKIVWQYCIASGIDHNEPKPRQSRRSNYPQTGVSNV